LDKSATELLPEELRAALPALKGVPSFSLMGAWRYAEGLFIHEATVTLSEGSGHVAAVTRWSIATTNRYPEGPLIITRTQHSGVRGDFAHELPGRRPCVITRARALGAWDNDPEPTDAFSRLAWNAARLVEWVEKAARGTLLKPGDPFGHPLVMDPTHDVDRTCSVSTLEDVHSLAVWKEHCGQSGEVELACTGEYHRASFTTDFIRAGQNVVRPRWGAWVEAIADRRIATWVLLAQPPFTQPWGFPVTWGELRQQFAHQGLNLDELVRKAMLRDGESLLLIGYPVPETMGEQDVKIQWQACKLPTMARCIRRMRGFRDGPGAWWVKARQQSLRNDKKVPWIITQNQQPSELGSRGFLAEDVRTKKFVLIGAGALGSAVAENLVRTGVTEISLLDHDSIQTRNLVRHTLTMTDVPGDKATLVAQRLASINPLVRPAGFEEVFPPKGAEAIRAVEEADVVIDTTGNDDLPTLLGQQRWASPKVFISLSVGWRVETLYAYGERTTRFNAFAYHNAVDPHVARDHGLMAGETAPLDGIGCWDPVWPGLHTDVQLMAAAGARFIADFVRAEIPSMVRVFEQAKGSEGFLGLQVRTRAEK
jgi:predicted dinucleotide-binding enzyme